MADATVTRTNHRPSIASGTAHFGALVLAWATYMTLEFEGGPIPGYCSDLCVLVYTPTETLLLQVLLYSSLGYALVVWLAPWSGPTAFLTVLYTGGGSLLTVFLLVRLGPLYDPLVVIGAAVGTFLITYGVFVCPDPLSSPPS